MNVSNKIAPLNAMGHIVCKVTWQGWETYKIHLVYKKTITERQTMRIK